MRRHIQGIDHVVIAAGSMDTVAKTYRQLGFTLTPRGYHSMGSENHCVMFESDYFELLTVPRPHPATRYFQSFVEDGGDGMCALALMTDDAAGFHDELERSNVNSAEPLDFSRPVKLPEGTFDAVFRITQVDLESTPAGRVFACQHFTRDVVWRSEYITHPNGVLGLASVIVITQPERVESLASAYGQVFDSACVPSTQFMPGTQVDTGNLPLQFTSEAAFTASYPGLTLEHRRNAYYGALGLRVKSLHQLRAVLQSNEVPYVDISPGTLGISGQYCHGVTLLFSEA